MSKPEVRRLDQWLANLGYCTRSQAKGLLSAGLVTIDGERARDTAKKVEAARILVEGEPLDHPEGIFGMLHKPVGYTCSHSEEEGPTVYELLPPRWRQRNPVVTSIGRLDKETSGVLLLTDHSTLVHDFTSPKKKMPKVYEARVDKPLVPGLAAVFSSGELMLESEKTPCLPAEFRMIDETHAELVLVEGRYHQVRRMFASQGYHVVELHRSRFGPYELEGLESGAWRDLPLPAR